MEPPEQRPPALFYALGDAGKPEHMTDFQKAEDILWTVARLNPNDHCFVRRSGGGVFTFAKVVSRQSGPEGPLIELQVNDTGSTKTIPLLHCVKYVRTLKSPHDLKRAQHRSMQRKASVCGPGFEGQSRKSSLHASFQSGLDAPPQRRLHRRSSVQSGLTDDGQQPRPSLNRQESSNASFNCSSSPGDDARSRPARNSRQGSLHASFQSGLSNGLAQEQRQQQQSPRTSFNKPDLRRGSSMRSSIITHVPLEENHLVDDSFELSSVESVSEASDADSTSSDEESPLVSMPEDRNIKNLRDSVKRVSLPGFDDIEFNEQSLLATFSTIGS